jgi:hypothetical protein
MLKGNYLFPDVLCLDAHLGREFGPFWSHSTIQMVNKYFYTCNTSGKLKWYFLHLFAFFYEDNTLFYKIIQNSSIWH